MYKGRLQALASTGKSQSLWVHREKEAVIYLPYFFTDNLSEQAAPPLENVAQCKLSTFTASIHLSAHIFL